MTESEWLVSEDPGVMLRWAAGKGVESAPASISDRKLRLFACACCLMNGARPGTADEYERDGYALTDRIWQDWEWAQSWTNNTAKVSQKAKCDAIRDIIGNPFCPVSLWSHQWQEMFRSPLIQSLAIAACEERDRRCLACNKRTDCKWCKNTRVLPREDGSLCPARLAILADALEEAGVGGIRCPRHDIPGSLWPDDICPDCKGAKVLPCPLLAHLRTPGPHYRGCWALDLILGKS